MAANQADFTRLKRWSVIKFLMAEKSNPCKNLHNDVFGYVLQHFNLHCYLITYPVYAFTFANGPGDKLSHHHHHYVVSPARISLTLSRRFSLSFIASGRSSGLYPESSQSSCMYFWAGRPDFARPYVGFHRSTSLMSSSLLLQQCPACMDSFLDGRQVAV